MSRRHQIDILLGSDHPLFHHVLEEVHGTQPSDPIARLTNLGRVCFGPTLVEEFRRSSHSHFTRTCRTRQIDKPAPLDEILWKFWELDAIGIQENADKVMTVDEQAATATVAASLKFANGHYEVGVPWKDGEPRLSNNYEAAMARLQSQERSLRKKGPNIMKAYSEII